MRIKDITFEYASKDLEKLGRLYVTTARLNGKLAGGYSLLTREPMTPTLQEFMKTRLVRMIQQ